VTTSATDTILSEVESRQLSPGTRAYLQARTRNRIFDLILSKFRREAEDNKLTRAELGRRIGRRPEVVTRLLSSPSNLTLDTVADLLFGIAGEELDATSSSPVSRPKTNHLYEDILRDSNSRNNRNNDSQTARLDALLGQKIGSSLSVGMN
jgi:hypothetical protein